MIGTLDRCHESQKWTNSFLRPCHSRGLCNSLCIPRNTEASPVHYNEDKLEGKRKYPSIHVCIRLGQKWFIGRDLFVCLCVLNVLCVVFVFFLSPPNTVDLYFVATRENAKTTTINDRKSNLVLRTAISHCSAGSGQKIIIVVFMHWDTG